VFYARRRSPAAILLDAPAWPVGAAQLRVERRHAAGDLRLA